MQTQKYSVNQHLIETLLVWVKSGEIAIPEIQRPFVWDGAKVRDLMDSLYQGYPVGYVITWRNPNVRLKDGSTAEGKKVLIDGQQRITALTAAILGDYVVNKEYKRIRIKISFNPILEKFDVQTPVILKDKTWIPDISEVLNGSVNSFGFINAYLQNNPDIDQNKVVDSINNLFNLTKKQIGLIDLAGDLDIETVTEIFIRINSKGVVLSQADFAMSKIAANDTYGGQEIRKAIDYFSHLAVAPEFYQFIKDNDAEFAKSDYFQKMAWLRAENEDLYDPSYTDVLRVAFTSQFNRGKLSDLVSLLSGRNFETRTFEEQIAKESFEKLGTGIHKFINETNFKRFIMIIKSAGFISPKLIRAQNALNVAYILYLKLREQEENPANIEKYVRRWFVLSLLTGRYSGSAESMIDFDSKQIANKPFEQFLNEIESADLSDAFWNASLVQSLDSSVSSSPYFLVYLASQVKANDKGFLSKEITVNDLITYRGDIHHIFPKDFLKKNGMERGKYNQIANYVYMQQEVNISVGNKAPQDYFTEILEQCKGGDLKYGGIASLEELHSNLQSNCIPESIFTMTAEHYDEFLKSRRQLMAEKMREYYFGLYCKLEIMKTYYRLYLGAKNVHAQECFNGNFVGVDFGLHQDLTGKFLNSWREFNKVFIPVYLDLFPAKKKVTAGLYCATIWVVSKWLKNGDIVLCPDGNGNYRVAEITGDYYYVENQFLPHRRPVKWLSNIIEKSQLSESLKNSMGSAFTYCDVTKYHEELDRLIGATGGVEVTVNDSTVEDPIVFALEKHLEDFLVKNWNSTELGREYTIYEEEGEIVGQQYPSDTGPIDILAISKDKKTLLVVELKRGRVSDNVVGQIQRYMGFVKEELAEPNQIVKGVIIGLEDDLRIRRALSVTNNIEYYRYEVSFKLNRQ